ncbi:MAG: ABC transporter ATP-binding protein [Nitriliruptorales bacterium]|nr:ABC transporter ATP-binding protein [Nitriliruptorales bacterium]
MADTVVQVRGISRSFGTLRALDEVSLDVERGEIVGLLGHNGAGKTTLLRIINGLLEPDLGSVQVFGKDPREHGREVRRRTGVVTESLGLDEHLTVRENLAAFAAMYGVPEHEASGRIDRLLHQVEVPDRFIDGETQQLSAGLRQRVAIARALVHAPEVLLLDEPTSNLDPLIARKIRRMVREVAATGRGVIVCTHNLPEAQATCDRIVILRRGQVLAAGSLEGLTRALGTGTIIAVGPGHSDAAAEILRAAGFTADQVDDSQVRIAASDGEVPAAVRALVAAEHEVHRVEPQASSLEELYVQIHEGGGQWTP